MKTAISPYYSKNNKYLEIIIDIIKSSDIEVLDYNEVRKDRNKMKDIDIVNLNWFENKINSRYFVLKIIKFIYLTIELIRFKFYGTKIIYTFHNKIPHDMKKTFLSKLFIKLICKMSDRVVMLSSGTKEVLTDYMKLKDIDRKAVLIPHPNYIGVFKDKNIDYRSLLKINEDELVLLFTGLIKPYKNIELIIEVAETFKDLPIKFIIAGKPIDDSYKEKTLKLLRNNKNIIPLLYFIDNDDISSLIKSSDVMLLPYDLKSSLNSGNIIQAFSYERTVISPLISTLKDFDESLYFSYTYKSEEEHKEQLKKQIQKVYQIYKENPNKLRDMGKALKEIVVENNSRDILKKKYYNLYIDLMKE